MTISAVSLRRALAHGSAGILSWLESIRALTHLSDDIDDFLTGDLAIDARHVERRATRAFGLDEEHLSVTAFHPYGALAPRSFEKRRELLSCFRKCVDRHGCISNILIPARPAAVTKP